VDREVSALENIFIVCKPIFLVIIPENIEFDRGSYCFFEKMEADAWVVGKVE